MKEEKLELSRSCHLVKTSYGEGVDDDISLDYTEYSSDHYHSDTETSVDLDKAKALEVIAFLKDAFSI
jgi:hypothetical protein